MITDFKNKTPFLLGLLFLAFVTAHEVEHISEAFEVQDEVLSLAVIIVKKPNLKT